jgi:hypothetical protein
MIEADTGSGQTFAQARCMAPCFAAEYIGTIAGYPA